MSCITHNIIRALSLSLLIISLCGCYLAKAVFFLLGIFFHTLMELGYLDTPINTDPITFHYPQPSCIPSSHNYIWPSPYPHAPIFSSSPEAIWPHRYDRLTGGTELHELHDSSSSGGAKADNYTRALASVGGSWENISDAGIVNKPPAIGYTIHAYNHLMEGTELHELHDSSSSGAAKADDHTGALASYEYLEAVRETGKWTTVESMGTAAGAHKRNSKERSSGSQAAWNTSTEKETGGWDSCGNACYTCGEADHFSTKCSLGADYGWSGHGSGGNSTTSYIG